MSDDLDRVVTVAEMRQAGYCVAGQKRWFTGYGFDFREVVRKGVTVRELLATGDANAQHVVDFIRKSANGQ